jgi:hypothetical protein
VEWSKAELEGWLIQQAYEGMLRAIEQDRDRRLRAVQAKTAIAELAESVLRRISRVIGGAGCAFTAAPVCARQRAPRRMLAGGPKGRTH